ncbi:MAG: DnaJ C-terminal domain-containing protein [Myxococcota bacterium]
MRDLYQALGLAPQAEAVEIKKAYRELTRRFHPDLNPGRQWATDRYKEVVEAYEVLSCGQKRALYDEFGEVAFTRGFDPDRARSARQRQSAPAHEPSDSGLWSRDVMDFADLEEVRTTRFDDFLDRFFGGRHPADGGEEEGLDLRATVTAPASVLISGGKQRVGYARADGRSASTEITIPAGTVAGSTLNFAGRGAPGSPPGALLVEVRAQPDPGMRIDGSNLHVDVPVPLRVLYEGGRVDVAVPFGRYEVKVPPATAPHKPLRLRGKGMPTSGKGRGDLIVDLRAVMPKAGDPELLAALRRLQR